jgi:putative N6-adenine-specific DNA methylase
MNVSTVFVSCLEHFERFLVKELKNLGITNVKAAKAGVIIYEASMKEVYTICYASRLALRVLWEIHSFTLWKPQNLYQQIVKMPWEGCFSEEEQTSFFIGVSGKSRHFPNTHYAVQRAKDAICDGLLETINWRPNIDKVNGTFRLHLHLQDEQASLYFDCSGASLNQRGYRQETGEAPLNEVVAASLLALAGYDGYRPFCDPCCGSGTLMMEAAMIASNIPSGFMRTKWGFEEHPFYEVKDFELVKSSFNQTRKELAPQWICGIEKDRSLSLVAQSCLRQINIEAFIQNCSIEKAAFDQRYFILTNPPFGRRLKEERLDELYYKIGQFMKTYGSRAFVFSSERDLLEAVDLPILQSHPVFFGGQDCILARFQVNQ